MRVLPAVLGPPPVRDKSFYLLLVVAACTRDSTWMPAYAKVPAMPPPPVGVRADETIPSVPDAMEAWNEAAGCKLFTYDVAPWVQVRIGSEGKPGVAATTRIYSSGALVEVYDAPDITTAYLVVVHELGHVLGLDHDASRSSVMRPDTGAVGLMESDDEPLPMVSRSDAEAVQRRYCP